MFWGCFGWDVTGHSCKIIGSLDLNMPYHPPLNFGIFPVTCGVKHINMAKQRVGQQRVSSLDWRPLNSKA